MFLHRSFPEDLVSLEVRVHVHVVMCMCASLLCVSVGASACVE